MKISFFTPGVNTTLTNGFGVAGFGMVTALQRLGHEVPYADPTAPVEIAFCQPEFWEWSSPDSYKIGYAPWESTRLPDSWLGPMKQVDEVWTTSPWCKLVFEKHGFENVRVYQHGIDPAEFPRKRRRPSARPEGAREIRFLHIGEPAPRKGGQLVYDTFVELFGDRTDVSLTIKSNGYNTVRGKNNAHPNKAQKNVKLITREFSTFEMSDLLRRHDVLVYPSWGEGFGLIPLQALVSGMPVICTDNWAPYRHLLLDDLRLPSKLVPTRWPEMHPGFVYEPDAGELARMMQSVADGYDDYSIQAYANSFRVEREYDWGRLTQEAFQHIFDKYSVTV